MLFDRWSILGSDRAVSEKCSKAGSAQSLLFTSGRTVESFTSAAALVGVVEHLFAVDSRLLTAVSELAALASAVSAVAAFWPRFVALLGVSGVVNAECVESACYTCTFGA